MKYGLVYTRKAERDIRKLEPKTRDRKGSEIVVLRVGHRREIYKRG